MKHLSSGASAVIMTACLLSVGCGSDPGTDASPMTSGGMGGASGESGASGAGGAAGAGASAGGTNAGTGGTAGLGGSAGAPGGSGGGEAGTGSPIAPGGACAATAAGVYAVRAILPVYWDNLTDQGVMKTSAAGRGEIVGHVRFEIPEVDDTTGAYTAVSRLCGLQLPPTIIPILGEAVQPIYPDDLWEKMPNKEIPGTFSGFQPGATFTLPRTVRLMGISLASEDAPWPTSAETTTFSCAAGVGVQCFPDDDQDGNPGISNLFRREGEGPFECGRDLFTQEPSMACIFAPAPLQSIATIIPGAPRAKSLYMATRSALQATFTFDDNCIDGTGTGKGEYFQSRAYSCLAETDAMEIGECIADQQTFIDTNLPIYVPLQADEVPPVAILDKAPSAGPKFAYTRLGAPGAAVDCAAVRAAAFPE